VALSSRYGLALQKKGMDSFRHGITLACPNRTQMKTYYSVPNCPCVFPSLILSSTVLREAKRRATRFLPSAAAEGGVFLPLLASLRRPGDGGKDSLIFGRRVDRCRLGFAGGVWSVPSPPPRIKSSGPPPRWRSCAESRSRGLVSPLFGSNGGVRVPERDRRGGGGDLVGGFWSPSSSASRRRFLQRRREDWSCTGDLAAGQVWLVLVLKVPRSVRSLWPAAGRSGVDPRRGRQGAPYLEIDDELGARPRPTSPSDKVSTFCAPQLRFTKPLSGNGAASTSGVMASVPLLLGVRHGVAGVERRMGSGAGCPKHLFVISQFFGVLSAKCTGLRVLLDRSVRCVRVMYLSLI
jgi:hypothetical protein